MKIPLVILLFVGALSFSFARASLVADAPDAQPAEERLKKLGGLEEDLDLWISMETTKNGGLVWSRNPVKIVAAPEVVIRAEHGRKWMDFQEPGALLKLEPVLKLPGAYTLCTWMRFPAPHGHGMVWQGTRAGGAAFFASANGLFGWSGKRDAQVHYAPLAPEFDGWHHVAVVCDGEMTRLFLDGRPKGKVDEVVETDLLSIGNHWSKAHQSWMMCGALRQQFIFHRALAAGEVRRVMKVEE